MTPLGDIIRHYGLRFHMYADDTQIYYCFKPSIENYSNGGTILSDCISDIRGWMRRNFLKLNDDKTEILVIGSKLKPDVDLISLTVGLHAKCSVEYVRNLGVIFDKRFDFCRHVNNLVKCSFYHIRNIAKIRGYLTKSLAETLVHAIVSSRLDFCNSLLYGLPNHVLKKLQQVQNAAARVATLTDIRTNISPVLKSLHWLPIKGRIIFKILLITFKVINGRSPSYLSDIIVAYSPKRYLRSSDLLLLAVPRTYSAYGDRAISKSAPVLWNQLTYEIRSSSSNDSFKNKLKTYLFKCAYSTT